MVSALGIPGHGSASADTVAPVPVITLLPDPGADPLNPGQAYQAAVSDTSGSAYHWSLANPDGSGTLGVDGLAAVDYIPGTAGGLDTLQCQISYGDRTVTVNASFTVLKPPWPTSLPSTYEPTSCPSASGSMFCGCSGNSLQKDERNRLAGLRPLEEHELGARSPKVRLRVDLDRALEDSNENDLFLGNSLSPID